MHFTHYLDITLSPLTWRLMYEAHKNKSSHVLLLKFRTNQSFISEYLFHLVCLLPQTCLILPYITCDSSCIILFTFAFPPVFQRSLSRQPTFCHWPLRRVSGHWLAPPVSLELPVNTYQVWPPSALWPECRGEREIQQLLDSSRR